MKAFAIFLLGVSSVLAVPLDFDSKISKVTVYSDRASVQRTAQVEVPGGRSVLRFKGLPTTLSVQTVQLVGKTDGVVTVLGAELKNTFASEAVSKEVRKFQGELQTVENQIQKLNGRVEDLLKQKRFLDSLRGTLSAPDSKGMGRSLNEIKELYAFYGDQQGQTTQALLEVHQTIDGLKPERERLNNEIAQLQSGAGHKACEIWVAVDAERATKAEIAISYDVPDASWSSVYDARVNTTDGKITLQNSSLVRQNTGENWDGVQLLLSTARVEVSANMPKLSPWWLQFLAPRGSERALKPAMAPASPTQELQQRTDETSFSEAKIRSNGLTTLFEVPLAVSIPSNNEPTLVPITQITVAGELEYVATPKLSQNAYVRTRAKNTSGGSLLEGEVHLFRDGVYVGKGELPFTAVDGDFVLYLGIDESIRIERQLLADRSEQSGLIRKRKGISRVYQTTIENLKKTPVTMLIYDQIPVSQDADISVLGVSLKPEPKSVDAMTGEVEWAVELKPAQKQIIDLGFTVEWPLDKEIGISDLLMRSYSQGKSRE